MKHKIIRIATVPISLDKLLEGQLKYLSSYYKVIAISGEDRLLRNVEKREGVQVFPINMQRSISPIKDVISLWSLYKLFKKEQPFIVHSITPKAGLLSMLAAKLAGVPIRIHTFTGLIFPSKTGLFQKLLTVMDKLLCACATNVYPEGEGVKNNLIQYKITSKPLKVLANGNVNGIDTTYFSPQNFTAKQNQDLKNSLGISPNNFVFIFVGRLVSDKGINELVNAFQKLQNKFPSREGLGVCRKDQDENQNQNSTTSRPHDFKTARLLLVGPLETDLDPLKSETLEEIKNNSNIISVGYQQDVRPYLAISNALVFPSYREGFPNVVMQAGAMGLPSIVTNINGCNEIIKEGENGWIIPVKDEAAILNAMENCLTNSAQFNKAKTNARQLIVDRYEQKVVWEAILEEYRALEKQICL